jgi:hypothetical protein
MVALISFRVQYDHNTALKVARALHKERLCEDFYYLTVIPERPLWETNCDKLSEMSYKKN